jgi:hypothetical protein
MGMKPMRTIILIMLAALAMAAASAAYPVEVTVASDHAWMVADNKDTTTVTATVISGTGEHAGELLEGANVTFTVKPPWQLKDSFLVTDKKGVATTTLFATKAGGTANITVTASALILTETWGYLNYSASKTLSQPIDHGTPASIVTSFKSQVQVRTPTRISVFIRDSFGNPVDNRNVVEKVKFDASSKGLSGFLSGTSWVKSITVPVNGSGYADVQYLADPVGTNYVSITPPSPLNQKLIGIEGISQATPFSATSIVSPGGTPYPYTTVKTGYFTIGYIFYDQYGYPTMNQPVNISTNIAGESMSLITNKNGMVIITYGPKDIAGIYNITARAANNLSVSASPKVEFVSGAPTDALLTASPQTMASRDVKDDITSTLTMRVMDVKGNPVAGEPVNFRLTSISVNKQFNQTMAPVLENGVTSTSSINTDIPVVSDENGEAKVAFHPGAFTTDFNAPGYNTSATGTAILEAQWATVKHQVTLKYLNYRYLTIESEVKPETVRVNETVDLTVRVKGDGWALQPKPIDVMLLNDRSGSMLYDHPDRAVSVMNAALVFSDQLDYTRDYLGVFSFGGKGQASPKNNSDCGKDDDSSDDGAYALAHYTGSGNYPDYATRDLPLSNVNASIRTAVNSLVPNGYTPMRYVLKLAIDEMNKKGRKNAVKALVILSDGDYNYWGDPLARGKADKKSYGNETKYESSTQDYIYFSDVSNQNMARYANASGNITIYTIRYAGDVSATGIETLKLLADQTGGKNYSALSESQLAAVYTEIAGALRDEAGVNTNLSISLQNIAVNNVMVPGNQVYAYKYIPMHSTEVDTGNTSIPHFQGYPMYRNDTDQWNKAQTFNFSIGTIRLNQVWESTITLQVLTDGNIKVFDPNSQITTQDPLLPQSTMPLKIPDVYITALQNNSAVTLQGAAHLQIQSLALTNAGAKTRADLKWSLAYDGMYPLSEDIMIAPFGTDDWIHLPKQQVSNVTTSDTASIPIDSLAEGYYTIRVDAEAYDTNSDTDTLNIFLSDTNGVSVVPPGVTPTPTITPGVTKTPKSYIKIG